MSRIVLIDGDSILQKAFYSVPMMTDATGFHTNAVYGFLNILFKLAEEKTEVLSVVFESEKLDSEKLESKDSQKMPAAYCEQLPVLKELLLAMNVHCLLYTSPSPRDTR